MWKLLRTLVRRLLRRGGPVLPRRGAPAPDFDLCDHHGVRRRLADFRGRKVVLWFYPKADTPG